jgi:hypothetical protein
MYVHSFKDVPEARSSGFRSPNMMSRMAMQPGGSWKNLKPLSSYVTQLAANLRVRMVYGDKILDKGSK